MRINIETFMALVVMIGAGGAITAAVMTSGPDEPEPTPKPEVEDEPAKAEPAPTPAPTPVVPPATKPTTPPAPVPPADTTGTFESELLEPVPDDPVEPVVPGPEFEGF